MPQWGVYISLEELGHPRATIREVVGIVRTLNRDRALIILGTYNLALSIACIRGVSERVSAQEALLRNCISESRLRELRDKLGNANLANRPLFHRAQLLTMIKLAAQFGRSNGGNLLESRDDFDVLAELGLCVNSLWSDAATPRDDIIPSLAAALEIENPPPVAESMTRARSMLEDQLNELRHDSFAQKLESIFLFSVGMNFEELLDLTFALWSYYGSLTVQDLVEDQRKGHFNPLNPDQIASGRRLTSILDLHAIPFDEVPGLDFGRADNRKFLHDHTPLRMHPIWRLGSDNYLCVDPAFIQEKLSSGVYWTVMNALDEDSRERFAQIWGRLFENHLFTVLESIYPADRVWRSPRYSDNRDEAFDVIIDHGEKLIVCQAKSSFVPIGAKYSGDAQAFFDGMESRFGDEPGAALRQIHDNLHWCFGLEGRRSVPLLEGRHFREILPIVVYQEPVLRFGLVTQRFAQRLETTLLEEQNSGRLFRADIHVRPVIFIHIDDFHLLAPYIRDGDVTLVDVLHEKLGTDRTHLHSLDAFWREQLRPRLGLSAKGDQVLAAEWQEYSTQALRRFRAGIYQ